VGGGGGWLVLYLGDLCLFAHNGLQHTLCFVFLRLKIYVASFSALLNVHCPSGFL
jgi:hypothetical protein